MAKLPSFQFYPGDWRKDPDLNRCSKAAKGVWIDMLALLFECSDRGVFSTGGEPWSDQEIAAAIGGDIAENLTCLSELLRKGVANRNDSGATFCRRMVRDEQKRKDAKKRFDRFNASKNANTTQIKRELNAVSSSSTSNHSPPGVSVETPSPSPPKLSALAELWNEVCLKLPQVREVTKDRQRKEKLRLKERGLDEWRAVFQSVEASPFCGGENDRGWRATFDWIIANPSNGIKVLEGKYDPLNANETQMKRELNAGSTIKPPSSRHPQADPKPVEEVPLCKDPVEIARWQLIEEELKARIDPQNYDTWVKPVRLVEVINRTLVLAAPNEIFIEWIHENLNGSITAAIEAANVGISALEFILSSRRREEKENAL